MTTWWERAIAQTPGLLDSPQAQTFLHAVHLRKVGRVARFWAAKGPLAPRKEGRKKGALEGRRLLRSTIHFHREAAFVSTLRAR